MVKFKMPKTPVLTKKQQKASLSAKKTKTKQTIRNVLATPYAKYWPLVFPEHTAILHGVLYKHLPRLVKEGKKIPWRELKQVPKSERKSFRMEYLQKHGCDVNRTNLEEKKGLVFGVNDSTRAIENGVVKSVLITEDVQPRLMIEHLIDQCVLFRIPVLVVPGLRNILKNTCGFSSIAIAFTESVKFKTVQQLIEYIFKKYPVPRDHINFQRSLDLVDKSVIVIEDSMIENSISEGSCKISSNSSDNSRVSVNSSVIVIEDSIMEGCIAEENSKKGLSIAGDSLDITDTCIKECEPETNSVYLYRKAKDKRTFVPEKSNDRLKNSSQMQVDSTGFLSFSVDPSQTIRKKYMSLKVKRIKGDVNRNKRKIEKIKQAKARSNKKKKTKG